LGILTAYMMQPRLADGSVSRLSQFVIMFCLYAALVSGVWAAYLGDVHVCAYAVFYAFNYALLAVCLRVGLVDTDRALKVIAYATAVTALVQAAAATLFSNADSFRQTASFNNPNQLGYWSLLSMSIFLACVTRIRIKWYIQGPAIACLCYTTALSLSKAAMISLAVLLFFHFVRSPKLILLAVIAVGIGSISLADSPIVEKVKLRLENIGEQSDDSLYSRGYIRMIEYPEYMILGAAEGALYRFNESDFSDVRYEVHSTFGTILFSYGLIGSALFCLAMWQLYKISHLRYCMYVFPAFLYGLTHQGLRFSLLWLLFAVIALLGVARRRQKAQRAKAAHIPAHN
jgi:hypothetical protein